MRQLEIRRSELLRVIVAIDPATTSNEDSDDTGIIVCSRGPHQPQTCSLDSCPGHGFVLGDYTCHLDPTGWARQAILAYDECQGDRIIAEVNNGGDMVGTTVRSIRPGVPYDKVNATRGKLTRAEPISALQEQGRIHMLGEFPELEKELTTWSPDSKWSPNRLDALVWGMTYLGLVGGQGEAFLQVWQREIEANAAKGVASLALSHIPRQSLDEPGSLRPGCKHRFQKSAQGDYCVNCAGIR